MFILKLSYLESKLGSVNDIPSVFFPERLAWNLQCSSGWPQTLGDPPVSGVCHHAYLLAFSLKTSVVTLRLPEAGNGVGVGYFFGGWGRGNCRISLILALAGLGHVAMLCCDSYCTGEGKSHLPPQALPQSREGMMGSDPLHLSKQIRGVSSRIQGKNT